MNKWKFILGCLTLLSFGCKSQANLIQHAEPANWWANMQYHQVQILLHGKNIANYQVEAQGIQVLGITKTENPNYLFVTVETEKKAAGIYPIRLKDGKKDIATFNFELKNRREGSALRTSFTSQDVVYLLMPDRFANGNPSNDSDPTTLEKANRSLPGGRHGGDIRGIINHLDYIADLGATTIWTTPLLLDNDTTYSYHTYGQSDLYKVDPRYGTNEEFCELVEKAHAKGLKVIKDEVPNHWSYTHWMMNDLPTYTWLHQFPGYAQSNYRTTAQMDPHASKRDSKYCSEGWFVRSMPDLNQNNPLVLNYLIQNTIWWVEYANLDGLRVDTYPYNEMEGIAKWTKAITDEYPNLNLVGEVWLHDQADISFWQKNSPIAAIKNYNSYLPSVMDFTLHDAMMEAFKEQNQGWDKGAVRFYENFANDFLYANSNNILTFFENHDTQRFNEVTKNPNDYKLALSILATTRGIPQLYYGSEIGMRGDKGKGDADIRQDFPGGWSTDSQNAFTENGRSAEQKIYFDYTKKLMNWRKNKAVIHSGKMTQFIPENNVYVYFRHNESEKVMVIINNSEKEETLNLSRFEELLTNTNTASNVINGENYSTKDKEWKLKGKTSYILELK